MNRLFNPLSDEILKTNGTIDKYIGDAIMAFWNAPVEDPDHAVHAIQAARAMLKAVDALNAERAREAPAGGKATPLRIGIGINTGDCVVGNIGSDFRFNYSALGDPVNLASRLESETKGRHLDILVGEETARRVGARLPLAPVGRITVKGKSEAVSVFTPVDTQDRAPLEAHRALMEAIEAGEVLADDPRFETLAAALPQLAGFYAACAAALRLGG
jgi:adenylate cyclase